MLPQARLMPVHSLTARAVGANVLKPIQAWKSPTTQKNDYNVNGIVKLLPIQYRALQRYDSIHLVIDFLM